MNDTQDIYGLTKKEVEERIAEGKVNGDSLVKTKSIKQIVFSNVFSLFNIINTVLAVCVFLVHSYKNMLFMGVVFWNAVIGIVQEIRSKKIIDKLSILSSPNAYVLRDGNIVKISIKDIVLDDIIVLRNGYQICADAVIISGECEVNESLITGESDAMPKGIGDSILSGSFVTSGEVYARVVHVGMDNYVNTITGKAKYIKKPNSEIMSGIKAIIKVVTIALVPVTAILFYNQLMMPDNDLPAAVVGTVAAVIGMIPSGCVLLTTVALAVSVIRMAKRNVLVQEMYCIETLARVDVLCLDKTGTITEGTMNVEDVMIFDNAYSKEKFAELMYLYTMHQTDVNATFDAIKEYALDSYNKESFTQSVKSYIPFSSDKKWGGMILDNNSTIAIGAYEYIVDKEDKENKDIKNTIANYSKKGLRVLVVAQSMFSAENKTLPKGMKVIGIIVIADKIRKEAYDTIAFFRKQGVALKVISGDNPETVAYIADKAGIPNAHRCTDTSTLNEEELKDAIKHTVVFGRVKPEQKQLIISELKKSGHVVAMTGDGVNDVMALKEADCSIAMQSGSDAARCVSQLILMDSNFASMPHIVAEGRRAINNLQNSASLYLTKTIYSTALAVLFVFLNMKYPFIPIQLTLIGALFIGLPSFALALEPNNNRIKGSFLANVGRIAIPGGAMVFIYIISSLIYAHITKATYEEMSTISTYALAIAAGAVFIRVCQAKDTFIKRVMPYISIGAFVAMSVFLGSFFGFEKLSNRQYNFVMILLLVSGILLDTLRIITEKFMGTSPNIYDITFAWTDNNKMIVINDEVEPRDYEDISRMIMNRKVFKADKVVFFEKAVGAADILIDGQDNITDEDIAVNVMVYAKKVLKLHGGIADIKVEKGDKKELIYTSADIKEGVVRVGNENNDEANEIRVHMGKKRRIVL